MLSRAFNCSVIQSLYTKRPAASVLKYHVGLHPTQHPSSDALVKQKQQLRTQGVVPQSLNTPVFQVFGSNTDVGKTVVSAGICRGAASFLAQCTHGGGHVAYIKPLQTGIDAVHSKVQGDASFVEKYTQNPLTGSVQRPVNCSTLVSWRTPVSPHLAAQLEGSTISDEKLLELLADKLQTLGKNDDKNEAGDSLVLVETAGGVCSPTASMRFQVDVYRALRLPVVLVGDGKLGGISTTMSALESLLIRGYDVAAICLIEQDDLDNAAALEPRTSDLGIPIFTMQAVPPMPESLDQWYLAHDAVFADVTKSLKTFHTARLERFKHMEERAEKVFWWPFTQHKQAGTLSIIDSAHGDEFGVYRSDSNTVTPLFDACASWWTQGVGHGNSKMATALAYAAGRYGHVMFPENAHEPALQLSEKLLASVGKGWASRVYYSDDGSTAVEVALKMAFRKYVLDHKLDYSQFASDQTMRSKMVTLAQANCYHGDTLGVMNVAEKSVFNEMQHPWYRPEGVFLKVPTVALRNGSYEISIDPEITGKEKAEEPLPSFNAVFDASRDQSPLADVYRKYVAHMIDRTEKKGVRVGSALIEPVLMGSGGMFLVDPLYQRVLVQECRARQIPVIYDEVFSGWWRLGVESARDLLGIDPDIACYAKLLTGGVVPMAATLASEEVFNTFYADSKGEALLHGHSFTAYPIGCAAAVTALDMYQILNDASVPTKDAAIRTYWNIDVLTKLSTKPYIERTFAIGTVACVELAVRNAGYASTEAAELIQVLRKNGVYARSLGNVLYLMCSPLTTQEDCNKYLTTFTQQMELLQAKK
uniref:Dethiobiotin synthase n=1 Tax=Hyaloperonospora arabidopsidis (strain Emoy2) TaxID=559515 RepID=M4BHR7_HYAAE